MAVMRPLQPAMDALWRPLDVAAVILAAIALYLYLPQLIKINRAKAEQLGGKDFARNLRQSGKKIIFFYGSQTGTAKQYALRLAKEAKARYGLSSILCDPQEYDFNVLDQIPKDTLVVFVLATYGEGEPTDNALGLVSFFKSDELELSRGSSLQGLKYALFALGNSNYEHFCSTGRFMDQRLAHFEATRLGPRGEGDDDKALEEDYLAWKDLMWAAVEKDLAWIPGRGSLTPDFEIKELDSAFDKAKTYLGELSYRALTGSKGIHDAANPYLAPVIKMKELFQAGDRACIFAEFDLKGSGMKYRTGDHLGVWPVNPNGEVERVLKVLGLQTKRDLAIDLIALDPDLAQVPFPTPTTYDSIFRFYLDINQTCSRQTADILASYAPSKQAKDILARLGKDREFFHAVVVASHLNLAQVLELAIKDCSADITWSIPFERIVSFVPRLQPRYYSISSSSRMHPDTVQITSVVLKYKPSEKADDVFGLCTNYLLNLKQAVLGEIRPDDPKTPVYELDRRGKQASAPIYKVPIHIRTSNFRPPASVRVPIIMIGPGTGVAPFRAFVQERVAAARKAKQLYGEKALDDWGTLDLFYGCRRRDWDFLYSEEWKEYADELDGKFRMHVAFSREPEAPKVYVQQLVQSEKDKIINVILERKGYLYICGDAKNMASQVEASLAEILGEADTQASGAEILKTLKERKRFLLDVWS